MPVRIDPDYAIEMDAKDELAPFRDEFVIIEREQIYLNGSSLGRLPRRTREKLRRVVDDEWGHKLIRSWHGDWFTAGERIGGKIAATIGAKPGEVIVSDSSSVNLFKLVVAALKARPGRKRIVTDDMNFPSDLYIIQGVIDLLGQGHELHVVRSPDGVSMPPSAIAEAVTEDTALVTLSHIAFKSGFLYDMPTITEKAHRAGALMLWDLGHSVGAIPINLDYWNVDLAVSCTYKYLNGGPGAPSFLYVRENLQDQMINPIAGWFGQKEQFEFTLDYEPAAGLRRFLVGTPSILSLLAIEPAIDVLLEAGVEKVREKSVRQTEYLIGLFDELLAPQGFTLNTPRDPARRGSHVSIGHEEGLRINRALVDAKVQCDFRYPDNLRLGISPLYNSYEEVHEAVMRLYRIVDEKVYERFSGEKSPVT